VSSAPAPERATLAVRPERIKLNGPGSLTGRIEQVTFNGPDTAYVVALDGPGESRLRLRVSEQNAAGSQPRFALGDRANVTLPREAVRVLAE